jgi:hypothetical protein
MGAENNDHNATTANTRPLIPGGHVAWVVCLAFAAFPLMLFLVVLEVFTNARVSLDGLLAMHDAATKTIFSPAAPAYADVSLFSFAIYLFVHTIICLAAIGYFIVRFSAVQQFWSKIAASVLFAAIVAIGVALAAATSSAFRAYMVEPLIAVLSAANTPVPFESLSSGPDGFLVAALLYPTSLGIVAVLMASGSFHAALFFKPHSTEKDPDSRLREHADTLRHDLVALSIVLVSSVMTARAYFAIPGKLFDPSNKTAVEFYKELSQSLSTGAGLLFSATLIAAFLPGFLSLISTDDGEGLDRYSFQDIWTRIASRSTWLSDQFKGMWQSIAALIAPAVSAPFLDLLAGFFG